MNRPAFRAACARAALLKNQRPVVARETAGFFCFASDHRSLLFPNDNVAVVLRWFAWLIALTGQTALAIEQEAAQLLQWRNDACLHDVTTVGSRLAWAVGDRGAIYASRDGGATWTSQDSGVSCSLRKVVFLNKNQGWAVGGATEPYTGVSRGVVLRTVDGGRHWQEIPKLLLPALHALRMFDSQHGAAFGQPSALFPSGVFTTDDAGRSWRPVPSQINHLWLAGDFVDPHTGAMASAAGPTAVVRRRTIKPARPAEIGLRAVWRMQLEGPTEGWAVGDGGLVLKTEDLGQSWQTVPGVLPREAEKFFDFYALAHRGEKLWVAGSPGTRVFVSHDRGRSFVAFDTASRVPVHGLAFADDRQGIAVGDLGTILVTRDGGETWQVARAGGRRAAVLGLFAEPAAVPWELLARLSAGEGYLGVCSFLTRSERTPRDLARSGHEALLSVGGSGTTFDWRFPRLETNTNGSFEQLLGSWNRLTDTQALELFERQIARQIRLWRPEVVFTQATGSQAQPTLESWINERVVQAVERAADATRDLDLAEAAGLEAWQVKRVFGTLGEQSRGTVNLETDTIDPRLGRSLADQSAQAHGLIAGSQARLPQTLGFQTLLDHAATTGRRHDFFSGIGLSPGGDARRPLAPRLPDAMERLRRAAQKQRNMRKVIRTTAEDPTESVVLLGQVDDLTSGLDAAAGCRLLNRLALGYQRRGQWELAAETYRTLADRYPDEPLAHAALVWLLQYQASGEVARCCLLTSRRIEQTVRGVPGQTADGRATPRSQLTRSEGLAADGPRRRRERLQKALAVADRIERIDPILFAEPALRFPLAVAQRRLGYTSDADRWLLSQRRAPSGDAWHQAAAAEHWLTQRQVEPPKPVGYAVLGSRRPHLDGRLEEAFWRQADAIQLTGASESSAQSSATVKVAYDQRFLYLAIRCERVPGVRYADPPDVRQRDVDLAGHDRVEILLDVDRDYTTYYRLSIDHRGAAADACWGDVTWNPRWFIATDRTAVAWTVEAAIPLAELTGERPQTGHVWALGIERTVPGVGGQAWTAGAKPAVGPASFGLLSFH